MLAKGVSRQAITDLVASLSIQHTLSRLHAIGRRTGPDLPVNDWTLHQVDDDGKPVTIIQGLNEVLLSLDPTGREMLKRGAAEPKDKRKGKRIRRKRQKEGGTADERAHSTFSG